MGNRIAKKRPVLWSVKWLVYCLGGRLVMPIFLKLFRRLAKLRQRHFRYWKVVFFLVS